jgi:signal transduction histidine kinase
MYRSQLSREHSDQLRAGAILEAGVGIALVEVSDDSLKIIDVNDALAELTGFEVDALVNTPLMTLYGPRTDMHQAASLENAAGDGEVWRDTLILRCADDEPLPVTISLSPKRLGDLGDNLAILTMLDATALTRARNVQRLSNDISRIVGRQHDDGTPANDLAHAMVRDFADWCVIHLRGEGGSLDLVAIASRTNREPSGTGDLPEPQLGIGKVFSSGIPLLHQANHPSNPALARQMSQIIGTPVRSVASVPIASNAIETFGTISWAITDDARLYHHEDVQAAEEAGVKFGHYLEEHQIRASLARAVRAREGFMKAAGHELRTPLVSIKGYTQLLLRDLRRNAISPDRLEAGLTAIDTATTRLTDLMEDLFAITNPGLNSLPLRLVTVDIHAYIRDFLATTPSLTLAGHHIMLEEPDEPLLTQIDMTRFSQVLFNVVINAVHFSPADSDILIETRPDDGHVLISVRDRGRGLAAGEEMSIFDPFTEARASHGTEQQGLGISLYISRQIVHRHQGEMWAESEGTDKGATLFMRLPLVPGNE